MRKALKAMLGAGIALGLAGWIYDEAVGRYQMWVDALLFRAISVERLKELEEIEAAYKSCEVA